MTKINPYGCHISFTREQVKDLGVEATRQLVIEDAVEYLCTKADVTPADAMKLISVFHGERAPCSLIGPELYLGHVNQLVEEQDLLFEPLSGHVLVQPRDGGPEYKVQLAPSTKERPQHLFTLCHKRLGPARKSAEGAGGMNTFWSHSLLIPETQPLPRTRDTDPLIEMAMILMVTVITDGTSWDYRFANNYRREVTDPNTNLPVVKDRLAKLVYPQNLMALCANTALLAGMPIDEARKNMQAFDERQQLNAARFGRSTTPVTSNGPGGAAAALGADSAVDHYAANAK